MNQQICEAIKSKHHLSFNYDGLPRVIEPHAHGTSSTGKEVVRGFQTDGKSSSGPLGWRLWDVTKMNSFYVSESTFAHTALVTSEETRTCILCTASSSMSIHSTCGTTTNPSLD